MPYIKANGINMYYEEQGSGDPVLLIMGITAPGSVWEKHADYWKQSFRCIMPDNRGVGFTDKPDGAYTTAQMADDMAALLEALDIKEAQVVGVSMGSTIAQQMALRHPDKVKSIALLCPWARCDRKAVAVFHHMMHAKRLRPEEFSNFAQQLIYSKSSWDDDAVYNSLMDGQKAEASNPFPQPLHGLEGQAHACITHDVLADLPTIRKPCLVVGGKEDIFTPEWMAREVAGAIPGSELYLYEDAGHVFHWEKIDDFNPRILRWLKANA